MDSVRRQQRLSQLGIETWRLRSRDEEQAAQAQAQAAETAASHAASLSVQPAAEATPATARPTAPSPSTVARPKSAPAPAIAPSVDSAAPVRPALRLEDLPLDWDAVAAAVADCRQCRLCETRTNTVFGVGSRHAPLMVIGEGPGADEDARGEPFVGRAGKLLDEMLRSIGRRRSADAAQQAVFIANVVKCRPPNNRDPAPDEVAACRNYLDRQIQLVKPRLLVALGRVAAERLLATDAPLSKLRGGLHHYGPDQTPLLVTYHPAYLLRSPGEKAKSWLDLKRIHRFLTEGSAD